MIKEVSEIIVKYNNRIVGYLKQLEKYKFAFQYDKDWIENGFSISPFTLPLTNKIFISNNFDFDGLFGVFYESLPDGWGRHMISLALAKDKVNYEKLSTLTKLSLIPKNGLGGLAYHPSFAKKSKNKTVNYDNLQKKINSILDNKLSNNLDDLTNMGSASGGSRPKIHIEINNEQWIVKFKHRNDPTNIGEIEFKTNMLAKECGININEIMLVKSNICKGYFATKRFDIVGDNHIHVISLAGVLEQSLRYANLDYGHLAQVIKAISVNPKEDLIDAYKRMCFNVQIQNKDDHAKNFSFIYSEKEKGYRLSPAYDLTPTPDKLEHEMTVNSNGKPNYDDLYEMSSIFGLTKVKAKEILNDIHNKTSKYNLSIIKSFL